MRGESEKNCLIKVKKLLKEGNIHFCCDDKKEVANIIRNIDLTEEDDSCFPDFVFENGFIEHFQISGKKESSKGSEYNIGENAFRKEAEKFNDEFRENSLNTEPSNKLLIDSIQKIDEEYSYDWYLKSFKKHWLKHIDSLNKYEGNKQIGIFLIEYNGAPLNIKYKGKIKEFYKIYNDKTIVDFISDYKDQIKYVVYIDNDSCQIIQISKIIDEIQLLTDGFEFGTGRMINVNSSIFIDLNDIFKFLKRR